MGVKIYQDNKDNCWYVRAIYKGRRRSQKIGEGEQGRLEAKQVRDHVIKDIAEGNLKFFTVEKPAPLFKAPGQEVLKRTWAKSHQDNHRAI